MIDTAIIISWCILFFCVVYVYVGYPIVVTVLAINQKRPIKKKSYLPTVSLVIAAYNEEKIIEEKIKNSLAIAYPKKKLEILIFSDGSSDATDDIVTQYQSQGIRLYTYSGRKGKTYCQNETVKQCHGDIIVFSDANSMYDSASLHHIVKNFADSDVGVVCGELRYGNGSVNHESLYWKIETYIKKKESSINSCIGANGALYAIRKELYIDLPDHAISDFIEPILVYKKKYRVVYESDAFCTETLGTQQYEFARKRRIILRSLQSLHLIKECLNPFRYGFFSIQIYSHKILRWAVPLCLLGILYLNIWLLEYWFFQITAILQVSFYISAWVYRYTNIRYFSIPYYFCMINIAALAAILDFFIGKRQHIWNVVR